MVLTSQSCNIIEDSNHFLLVCKDYANIHETFFGEVYKDFSNFNLHELYTTSNFLKILAVKLPDYLYLDVEYKFQNICLKYIKNLFSTKCKLLRYRIN